MRFEAWHSQHTYYNTTNDKNGLAYVGDLDAGTYYVKEVAVQTDITIRPIMRDDFVIELNSTVITKAGNSK